MNPCHLLTICVKVEHLLTSGTIGLAGLFRGGMILALKLGVEVSTLYALPILASVETLSQLVDANPDDWRRHDY